jgi:hypothetical protein
MVSWIGLPVIRHRVWRRPPGNPSDPPCRVTASIARAILRKPGRQIQDGGRRMVASDSFAEFACEQLAPLGRVTMRRMFGKFGL